MALLRVYQAIDNDVWKLTFVNDPIYLSDGDKNLMRKFGEPEIDMGGTFLAETANTYVLPSVKAKVRADFPFTQTFDSRDTDFSTATLTKVEAYRDEIVDRFTTAMTTLRTTADAFTGEQTYNV